jgi:hypothetical protein
MSMRALWGTLAGVCLLGAASAAGAAQKISWAKSFDAAVAAARKANKLVMADFYTDW